MFLTISIDFLNSSPPLDYLHVFMRFGCVCFEVQRELFSCLLSVDAKISFCLQYLHESSSVISICLWLFSSLLCVYIAKLVEHFAATLKRVFLATKKKFCWFLTRTQKREINKVHCLQACVEHEKFHLDIFRSIVQLFLWLSWWTKRLAMEQKKFNKLNSNFARAFWGLSDGKYTLQIELWIEKF